MNRLMNTDVHIHARSHNRNQMMDVLCWMLQVLQVPASPSVQYATSEIIIGELYSQNDLIFKQVLIHFLFIGNSDPKEKMDFAAR